MPGATVHVATGNYAGDITTEVSGTAAARVRFVSDTRWGAKLRSGSEFVWNNKADYVDIEGFDVSGDSIARIGILNWASWVRVLNNRVHDIPAPNCPAFGGAGIDHAGYKSSDSDTLGNWIFNIGDYDRPCPRVHGIYQAEAGGMIQNNVVYRAEGWGIHLYHAAHDLIVANNTVFNNAYGGILVGQDEGKVPIADNILVTNNIVYRNGLVHGADGYGVREYGRTGIHNKYINNLVSGNAPGDWRLQNGNAPSGTIVADPHFADYRPDGTGDYRLRPDSPAVNTGTDVGAPANDFEGKARPAGSGFDIGAYEHLAASTSVSERRH
jgi:parallel beta-helix repeat protein